jgi:acyl-CoA synthetase (AMP-forming)/AMP-acid ligase II
MPLSNTLRVAAAAHPEAPAISDGERRITFRELEGQAARIAGSLRHRHGLQPGARVGLWMENCLEFLPALYGIWRAGLVAVPINNKLHAKELAWILNNAEARLCIVTPDIGGKLAEVPADVALPPIVTTGSQDHARLLQGEEIASSPMDPGAEAWLFYTSGTTGRPKGAALTHRNLLFMTHCYYADIDFIDTSDTILHAAPMSHGSGLYGLAFVAKGGHNVIVPGSFEPDRILRALKAHTNVSMFAAPTMVSRLINHPAVAGADTRNLKTIIYGGAAMYVADLRRALELFGPKLYQVYGQGSPRRCTPIMGIRASRRGSPLPAMREPDAPCAWSTRPVATCRRVRSARS